MKKSHIVIISIVLIIAALITYGNQRIVVTEYEHSSASVTDGLDGFKIVAVTDMHNKSFLFGNDRLIDKIKNEDPDIIVMMGDIVKKEAISIKTSLDFIAEASRIAPIYFLYGNHEELLDDDELRKLEKCLSDNSVTVLNQREAVLSVGSSSLKIYGALAPYSPDFIRNSSTDADFSLALLHYTENINCFRGLDIDLVLAGHTHGGLIRLPGVGGIYAPNQGYLPEYDYGEFYIGDIRMIVSSGLSAGTYGFRAFNPPEIVSVTLKKQ